MVLKNILLEIGTEEIPSRFLPDTLEFLEKTARDDLAAARVGFKSLAAFATPRRIALIVRDADERQTDLVNTFKGPAWNAAFDVNGNPTRAAHGFAKSRGVSIEQLTPMEVDGVRYACAQVSEPGGRTLDILPELLPGLIRKLVFPKNMYWDDPTVRFARPIRWILAMADREVIPFEYGGIRSGNDTVGHRFMGARHIAITDAADFMDKLYDNYVILDQDKRRQKMLAGIASLEKDMDGSAELDPEVINENLYLVEYPVPFFGSFSRKYLEMPEEVLTTSMKKNQKYFSVRGKNGRLLPYFVGVSNNLASNMAVVREGNERVLRARLEDAAFFWAEDLKNPLAANVERLKNIVYQVKLGSLHDKVMTTRELALRLCGDMGMNDLVPVVDRAAYLAKADLVTDMVYEFPELRGVMGREYAARDGENPRVALALLEQYLPSSSGDRVPSDIIGAILGICDRIDTIIGGFKAGLQPTGSQDQYGIRRASRTLNEILWGMDLDVNIASLVEASSLSRGLSKDQQEAASGFILQRLHNQLRERGFSHELTTLAVSVTGSRPNQALKLLEAFQEVQGTDWFAGLVTSAVRVRNILQKTDRSPNALDAALLTEAAERELYEAVVLLAPQVDEAVRAWDWNGLTLALSKLEPYISAFFDKVLVMDNDERIRNNRIALLERCDGLFKTSGDLGLLKA